jgi:hypothetical protein
MRRLRCARQIYIMVQYGDTTHTSPPRWWTCRAELLTLYSYTAQDIVLPVIGEGSLAQALWERLVDVQEGRVEWEGASRATMTDDDDAVP